MSAVRPKNTAVLISGRGSNMAALIDAAARPGFPAKVVLVISDKPEAPGLAEAAKRGIATEVVARGAFPSKEAHDAAITAALEQAGAEIVCLAGYMRLFTEGFVTRWEGRMINIHPALLPSFKGLDTHVRALDAGVRIHGCTAHFVSFAVDSGAVITQAAVPVFSGDTPERLAARVLAAEHKIFPAALALLASGGVRLEEGRAIFAEAKEAATGAVLFSPALPPSPQPADLESLARLTP